MIFEVTKRSIFAVLNLIVNRSMQVLRNLGTSEAREKYTQGSITGIRPQRTIACMVYAAMHVEGNRRRVAVCFAKCDLSFRK